MPLHQAQKITLYAAAIIICAALFVSANLMVEASRLKLELIEQKKLLAKTVAEHNARDRDVIALKNEIGQLRAQKALYTATIETLSKREETRQ